MKGLAAYIRATLAALFLIVCQAPIMAANTAPVAVGQPAASEAVAGDSRVRAQEGVQEEQKKLTERVDKQEAALAEVQKKQIDWWFAFLSALITLFTAASALFTYQTHSKSREFESQLNKDKEKLDGEYKFHREALEKIRNEANLILEKIQHKKSEADRWVQDIRNQYKITHRTVPLIDGDGASDETSPPREHSHRKLAEELLSSPTATPRDKVFARAVLASLFEKPDLSQLVNAYDSWAALIEMDPADSFAHANAEIFAGELHLNYAKGLDVPVRREKSWLDLAIWHARQALKFGVPEPWGTASNLGNQLARKAACVLKEDVDAAFELMDEAEAKYRLSLAFKPDFEEAQDNLFASVANFASAVLKEFANVDVLNDLNRLNFPVLERTVRLLERHKPNGRKIVTYSLVRLYAALGDSKQSVDELDYWYKNSQERARDLQLGILLSRPELSNLKNSSEFKEWQVRRRLSKEPK